jgi:uncharacterized protein with GYD domain
MLVHLTARHAPERCRLYSGQSTLEEVQSTIAKAANEAAAAHGVTVHSVVVCAPEHTILYLVESDDMDSVSRFAFSLPIASDWRVRPVTRVI